ncbi:2774_t:CDS:1, partial [Entrophospora sp. SA101]
GINILDILNMTSNDDIDPREVHNCSEVNDLEEHDGYNHNFENN